MCTPEKKRAGIPDTMRENALDRALKENGILILDGAMSTALEQKGFNTDGRLWTARALMDAPELIGQVHREYFRAGADCGISCSYQASVEGFAEIGVSKKEAEGYLTLSVEILKEARAVWWEQEGKFQDRSFPLCAASIGPYGACLADGSEYSGNYSVQERELRQFHEQRMKILWEAGPDLLAIETQPSLQEVMIEIEIAEQLGADYWVSFSCRDGAHICTGESLAECAERMTEGHPHLRMMGVNCVSPKIVEQSILEIRRKTKIPVVVYPNSGEQFDPENRVWIPPAEVFSRSRLIRKWIEAGATAVGGCCRTAQREVRQASEVRRQYLLERGLK